MSVFDDYDVKYPNLVMELLEYFNLRNEDPKLKSVFEFCKMHSIPHKDGSSGFTFTVDPGIVNKICKILCNNGIMSCVMTDGLWGAGDNYIVNFQEIEYDRKKLYNYFNSLIYGFTYIYRVYRQIVVPIVYEYINGDLSIGTGFKLYNGIVTAKHCLEGAKSISIKSYSKEELTNKSIFISKNQDIDIAFIDINKNEDINVFIEDGLIMQNVLTMGYPKIPAFTDFLTAELATISSIATERITPTKGSIAAFGENIFAKIELMLITAKIRGGNSGGPVINNNGSIVGIASQIPCYEGEYDDLGYGIAVPIKYLIEIINSKESVLQVKENYFKDFI
jgi:serine protease Do